MTIKSILSGIFVILISSGASYALEKGQNCPDFQVESADNSRITFSEINGNIVYIDFWASWCAPCKESLPWMSEIQNKYADKGLKVLAINLDSERKDAEKFLSSQLINFSLAFDPEGKSPELFQVSAMPTSFLIDRSGKIYEVFKGFNESEKEIIETKIKELIGE